MYGFCSLLNTAGGIKLVISTLFDLWWRGVKHTTSNRFYILVIVVFVF